MSQIHSVDKARAVFSALALVEPTGIADTAAAYMFPMCNEFADNNGKKRRSKKSLRKTKKN